MTHDPATIERLYCQLRRIRRVEEEIVRIYPTDKIKSPVHLSIGQEAVAVGVCDNLGPDDILYGTYRGHAIYLAKGGNLDRMMAELYGKQDGLAAGKAGSMHLGDVAAGMIGTSAIVGTTLPLSLGHAFALRRRGSAAIVCVFFGEGAMDEGVFHETANFAALKKLPILFVCENNRYAIYSHVKDRMPEVNLCERAEAYRIPARRIAGGDIFAIRAAAAEAVAAVRAGGGPRFLECETQRWRDHVGPGEDLHIGYRTAADLASWRAGDQNARLAGLLGAAARERIDAEVEAEIARAMDFAEKSPFPAAHTMYDHVYR
ncbi:MAG: thiamine pyrophosphate-dependent dehydrogenase E1 component subunit alpha [Candidatus Odyssella sp.]|nr:thiamine pyrophosphate-dependent dehydrogenase E1 component subunit alpha [Candidatus Odyssella sp.]